MNSPEKENNHIWKFVSLIAGIIIATLIALVYSYALQNGKQVKLIKYFTDQIEQIYQAYEELDTSYYQLEDRIQTLEEKSRARRL